MIKNINDYQNRKDYDFRGKNLNLILDSNSYKLTQEDIYLLRSGAMRGVRIL